MLRRMRPVGIVVAIALVGVMGLLAAGCGTQARDTPAQAQSKSTQAAEPPAPYKILSATLLGKGCKPQTSFKPGDDLYLKLAVTVKNGGTLPHDLKFFVHMSDGYVVPVNWDTHSKAYTICWIVPKDEKAGLLNYTIKYTVNGHQYTYSPSPSALPTVTAG